MRTINSILLVFCLSQALIGQESLYEKRYLAIKNTLGLRYESGTEEFIVKAIKDPDSEILLGKANYFFSYFDSVLEANKLPKDLKFLAWARSELNYDFKEPYYGGRGVWGLTYGQAKFSSLQITSYIDERLDYKLATQAFCVYIKSLYDIYQDWPLSIAAFICGPYKVNAALHKTGTKASYFEIRKLLEEPESSIIYKLQGAMYLYNYRKQYNLSVSLYAPDVEFFKYYADSWVSFHQIAEKFQVELDGILWLNPRYKKGIVPPQKNSPIYLPKEIEPSKVELEILAYKPTLETYNKEPELLEDLGKNNSTDSVLSKVKITHVVQPGETLLSIANKYKVSVKDLIELNNLPDDYQVSESETISISKQQSYAEKPSQKPKPSAKKTNKPKAKTHLVKKGESLSVIAKKYKCSVNDLKKWNGLRNNNIKPGQRLKILK